jgi:hypothetical protein
MSTIAKTMSRINGGNNVAKEFGFSNYNGVLPLSIYLNWYT